MSMQSTQIWVWREGQTDPIDGFDVEATDGSIGTIDEATYEVGGSYFVVDTGPWIFGHKVLLPAGVVERIDYDNGDVYVGLTKDQIKNAPKFDESTYRDDAIAPPSVTTTAGTSRTTTVSRSHQRRVVKMTCELPSEVITAA
jgi:hypothetical protein